MPCFSLALRILTCFILTTFAQSGPIAETRTVPAADPASHKPSAATPAPKAPDPISTLASRYVTEGDFATYVSSHSAMFSMRGRATDPFGQLQDPNAKRIIKTSSTKTPHRVTQVQATPFADIVRLIKVTTIMPKDKSFLIGTRSIKQGDAIPLNYRGKTFRVEVSSVNSHQIDFRNLDNNETGSLKLDIMPTGMTPGARLMSAPGMSLDRPDSPIELDSGNLPNEKSPAR